MKQCNNKVKRKIAIAETLRSLKVDEYVELPVHDVNVASARLCAQRLSDDLRRFSLSQINGILTIKCIAK